jgi:hypothetical protein
LLNETEGRVATGFVDVRNDNGGAIAREPRSNGAAAT